MAVAVSAVAAAVFGGVTIASVAASVAIIGVAAKAVGQITDSKELKTIGQDMVVGGTTVAAAASLYSAATDLFGAGAATADASGAATSAGITGSQDASPLINNTIDNTVTSGSALASTANPASTLAMPTADSGGLPGVSPLTTPGSMPTGSSLANLASPASDLAMPSATSGGLPNATSLSSMGAPGSNLGQLVTQGVNSPSGPVAWFNSLPETTKAYVATGLTQMAGGALGGLGGAYSAQQQLALQQLQNAQSFQKYSTALNNSNSPGQVSWGGNPPAAQNLLTAPVNSPTGLINAPKAPA